MDQPQSQAMRHKSYNQVGNKKSKKQQSSSLSWASDQTSGMELKAMLQFDSRSTNQTLQ